MANLVFPQLSSGALAQYPIRKTRLARTIKNLLADGNLLLNSDPHGSRLVWELEYMELSSYDLQALQIHFANCVGPFHAFTFIDPTDNMIASSADLTGGVWGAPSSIQLAGARPDPFGGTGAFTLTNNGQAAQGIAQTLAVPASYQYCFSVYVRSAQGAAITLTASGTSANVSETFSTNSNWTRITLSTRLTDPGQTLSARLTVGAGQQADIYGPQLEAQLAPSRYRPTLQQGGVYSNAHWATHSLPVIATSPGQFSTVFSIEASV
ncbi:MAG TPA: hypothetical protein VH351_17925 [Bryobacteraceae bacterium]|jgi:hypothetical protein|nr:hypothetical protein [Bryobacteraceae bacterium]